MPELPEVEVIRRGLQPHLSGRTINAIHHSGKRLRIEVPLIQMRRNLIGNTIKEVGRRAKYLLISFLSGDTLIIHLGMSGTLTLCEKQTPPRQHDHLVFALDSGLEIRYNDVRRFGSFSLLDASATADMEKTFFNKTGPEPFARECTPQYLHNRAKNSRRPIKSFLMDGMVIAGIGNIYANECLFTAKIHPALPAGELSLAKWKRLHSSIRKILQWAIDCGGSTINDFLNSNGKQGYFQANFKVYGKTNLPCSVCKTPLVKDVIGGRSSFHCPKCQKR